MDIGATVCTPKNPLCGNCPISSSCEAFINNEQLFFPEKKTKTARKPEKKLVFLIYINEKNEVFLHKRPSSGIWGGLWCFDECQDTETIIENKIKIHNRRQQLFVASKNLNTLLLTINLWITPIIINSPGGSKNYFKTSALLKGVPAPVKKIIQSL